MAETESQDIFFQCAQDPYAGIDDLFPALNEPPKEQTKKKRTRKEKTSKKDAVIKRARLQRPSFVINGERCKGRRVIKIQIQDISDSKPEDEESVLVSAQYIVRDAIDDIMEQTERIISNISKKLCGDSYFNL